MCCFLITFLDIFMDNFDVIISIRTSMFMPESHSVTKFVDYDAQVVTILADWNTLFTIPFPAHKRTATIWEEMHIFRKL